MLLFYFQRSVTHRKESHEYSSHLPILMCWKYLLEMTEGLLRPQQHMHITLLASDYRQKNRLQICYILIYILIPCWWCPILKFWPIFWSRSVCPLFNLESFQCFRCTFFILLDLVPKADYSVSANWNCFNWHSLVHYPCYSLRHFFFFSSFVSLTMH